MARSLGQLVDDIRSRLGIPSTDAFKTHAEIAQMIQASAHELSDLLHQTFGDEANIAETTLATVADQNVYSLDPGTHPIGALLRVAVAFDNRSVPMRKAQLETMEIETDSKPWTAETDIRYRFSYFEGATGIGVGSTIRFYPTPNAVHNVSLTYRLMQPFNTVSVSGQLNFIGFDEYIVLDCCAKYAAAEERDPAPYLMQKEAFGRRIELLAPPKDAGQPSVIHDVRSVDRGNRWF